MSGQLQHVLAISIVVVCLLWLCLRQLKRLRKRNANNTRGCDRDACHCQTKPGIRLKRPDKK